MLIDATRFYELIETGPATHMLQNWKYRNMYYVIQLKVCDFMFGKPDEPHY